MPLRSLKPLSLALMVGFVSFGATASFSQTTPPDEGAKSVELLKTLIRYDTSNAPGDTRQIAAYLKTLFDEAGIPNEIILAPNGKAAHFIARLKGDGSQRPVLLAAHTDVVPVQAERWSVDPFAAVEKDGFVYGRGALDNKGAVATFARAVIRLSKDRAPRSRDVIFLAEADEEQGLYNTNWLAENYWLKIDAEFSLNEGGRTLWGADGKVRDVRVSYADKLTVNLKLKTQGPSGHSSRPMPVNMSANGQLIMALAKISTYETEIKLSPETITYLKATAKLNPGPLAGAIAGLLKAQSKTDKIAAARALIKADSSGWGSEGLLRNTVVVTMINSGIKPNIIPGTAEAVMNARLLPGESVDAFIAELTALIDNPKAEFEIVNARPKAEIPAFFQAASKIKPSRLDTTLYAAIEQSAVETWPGAIVMPTLLVASTDATPWRKRDIPVYGIGPVPADPDTASRIHGDDERAGIEPIRQGSEFVFRILQKITASKPAK